MSEEEKLSKSGIAVPLSGSTFKVYPATADITPRSLPITPNKYGPRSGTESPRQCVSVQVAESHPDPQSCGPLSECGHGPARSAPAAPWPVPANVRNPPKARRICEWTAEAFARCSRVFAVQRKSEQVGCSRARITRSRILAELSGSTVLRISLSFTDGTSMWMSMRSSNGPEILEIYRWIIRGVQ